MISVAIPVGRFMQWIPRVGVISLIMVLCSCTLTQTISPTKIAYTVKKNDIDRMTSPFPEVSSEDAKMLWGQEIIIGKAFARDLDFYRAITSFKRAVILMPKSAVQRRLEVEYDIVMSYYCGRKYIDAIQIFEKGWLANVSETFPAYRDLLIILYDSYKHVGYHDKGRAILQVLEKCDAGAARKMPLAMALVSHDSEVLKKESDFSALMERCKCKEKSVEMARVLSVIPGAGYWYVGQKKSAMTSFLLNGLFIAAASHFFDRGDTAAGIITLGFEAGWYFGGINGAGIAAQQYNVAVFENEAGKIMMRERWFPVLMLQHAF